MLTVCTTPSANPQTLEPSHTDDPPQKSAEARHTPAPPKPVFVAMTLNRSDPIDMELIALPDGRLLLPVMALAQALELTPHMVPAASQMVWVDPGGAGDVTLDWEKRQIQAHGRTLSIPAQDIVLSQEGLLGQTDVYLEKTLIETVFSIQMIYDPETVALNVNTARPLKSLTQTGASMDPFIRREQDKPLALGTLPTLSAVIQKIAVHHTGSMSQQATQQLLVERLLGRRVSTTRNLYNSTELAMYGELFGKPYYVKPSLLGYNGSTNFQNIDWGIVHETKAHQFKVGSIDLGLSPLVLPALQIWGIQWASRNATEPGVVLAKVNGEAFSEEATGPDPMPMFADARQTAHRPKTTGQLSSPHTVLSKKPSPGLFEEILGHHQSGYAMFLGHNPPQFYPVQADRRPSIFLPQSHKGYLGGRYFYGLTPQWTVGLSMAADRIVGSPRSFSQALTPFVQDLSGNFSYIRDANFFQGETAGVSLRWNPFRRWLLSGDAAMSHYAMRPGSPLPMPRTGGDNAMSMGLAYRQDLFQARVDLFRYGTAFYNPAITGLANNLFDKQGVNVSWRGRLPGLGNLQYQLDLSRFQTNLDRRLPGGLITANHPVLMLSKQWGTHTDVTLHMDRTRGQNAQKALVQSLVSLGIKHRFENGLAATLQLQQMATNTLLIPNADSNIAFGNVQFQNRQLDASLEWPLTAKRPFGIKIAHTMSTFYNSVSLQGRFRYHQLFLEPILQLSYGDKPQHLNQFGLKVGYRLKSGGQIGLSFIRNVSRFQNAWGIPSAASQFNQVVVDFSDVFGLLADRIKALGVGSEQTTMLTGRVFLDYNQDGRPDPEEPGLPKIHLRLDEQTVVETDAKGAYCVARATPGRHVLSLDPEELPLTMGLPATAYEVSLRPGKAHRLDIRLLSEAATISGQVEVLDASQQTVSPEAVLLVLKNAKGDVLQYTTPDAHGIYRFPHVGVGEYALDLAAPIKASGRYQLETSPPAFQVKANADPEQEVAVPGPRIRLLRLGQ